MKIGLDLLKLLSRNENTMCRGQITLSKTDEICPLEIPNQVSTVSMSVPSLAKIHLYLFKLSSENENTDVSRADNYVKNCPLEIPNQIATVSMSIPSLAKVHLYLHKISSGNENMDVSRANI